MYAMASSRLLVRGLLLLMLSAGMLAAPLVLTVIHSGDVRAAQPGITSSNALQPATGTATPANAAGNLVSYKQAPLQAPLAHVVISEFRATGTSGDGQDEFVELFNPSVAGSTPIAIGGWSLSVSDCAGGGSFISQAVPGGATLGPGQHYLIGGLAYAGAHDGPLVDIGLADGGSIAIRSGPNDTDPIVDQVGFCAADISDYSEGTPLPGPLPNGESYERKFGGTYGSCLDNGDNATDFAIIAGDPQTLASSLTTCTYPTISGNVGVAGATFSYVEGLPPTTLPTSDASGNYSIQLANGWSGTITPSLAGYTFTPTSLTYSGVTTSLTAQNYAAALSTATPQSFASLSVVINEIGWAGTSNGSTDQWIELYNTTSNNINLGLVGASHNGWVLESPSWQTTAYVHLRGVIPAHGFFLLVHDTSTAATQQATATATAQSSACVVFQRSDISFDQVFTSNISLNGQILYLVDPNGNIEDSADRNGVPWPAGSTTNQRSMERRQGYADTTAGAWGTYGGSASTSVHDCSSAERGIYGTPKNTNWVASNPITPTPTATPYKKPTAVIPTPYAHVVINEFLPRAGTDWNQDGKIDVFDEFIELKNLGPIDVDLKNWKIDNGTNADAVSYTLPSKKLKPGERAVYYHSTTNIPLPDSGGLVRLSNTRGTVFDARGYGPVEKPDVSHCRIPDGYYWKDDCFPTPGLENSQTGTLPQAPPKEAAGPPPCLLADSVPAPFRQAECGGYGADAYDQNYWDQLAGQNVFRVPDFYSKAATIVE
jgi:hypothetical protein